MRKLVLISIVAAAWLLPAVPAAAACDPLDPAVCLQPWPNDFFHGRPDHRHRAAPQPAARGHAAQRRRQPDPPRRVEPQRRLQPGPEDRHQGAGARHARPPSRRPERCRSPTSSAPTTPTSRSSSSTRDTGQRHLIWSELDANPAEPGGRQPDHPARRSTSTRAGTTSSPCATSRTRRARSSRRSTPFRAYRDRLTSNDPAVEARRPHMERIFRRSSSAGIAREQPVPGLGLHRRQRAQPDRARAVHPRRRLRQARRQRPRRPARCRAARRSSRVTGTTDYAPCGDDGCQDGEDDQIARQVDGNVTVPCYLNAARLPARVAVRLPAPGSTRAAAHPRQHELANFTCLIPRVAVDGAQVDPARPSLYGHGLLGSASEVTAGQHQGDGQRAQLRVLRHRLGRHVDAGPAEHRLDPGRPLELPVAAPTAPSRGSSTSCTSGG